MSKSKPDRPIINVIVSDMHSGSDRAALPPRIVLPPLMADAGQRVIHADEKQLAVYNHLMDTAAAIRAEYPRHRKNIIVNGDAIEGLHHRTIQLAAPTVDDHVEIHMAIMREFLERVGFSRRNGDALHYVSGTEAHTGFGEQYIARRLADEYDILEPMFCDVLHLTQHGRRIAITHQWAGVGRGANETNSITNALKSMYFDSLRDGWDMPDLTVGSHYHTCSMGSFTYDWRTYLGIVTPSLQYKTRYAHQKTAFRRNDIGIVTVEVAPNGAMFPRRHLLAA